MNEFESFVESLSTVDWSHAPAASAVTHDLLDKIARVPNVLTSQIEFLLQDKELASLCEHYDFLDKLVLYKDPLDRFRVRLHMFLETTHGERPHNHRWAYSSLILLGGYTHAIYIHEADDLSVEETPVLRPVTVRDEKAGNIYTLDPRAFHTVTAIPGTVSLMIRGPAISERFLVIETRAGRSWWEYARECETQEEIRRRTMSRDRLSMVIRRLAHAGLAR